MRAIKLPWKVAREIRHELIERGAEKLVRLLDAAMEPRKGAAPAKARRVAKKAAKRESTAAIREAVFRRAGNWCELCGLVRPVELHHAFGRVRVKQAVSNCLALCRACHNELTLNMPSAAFWAEKQLTHFYKHGYHAEGRLIGAKLAGLRAKEELPHAP